MVRIRDLIAKISKDKIKDIRPELFDRTKETSIAEYIVSGLKVIESLPYIKFTDWEHITDSSKIDIKLNRIHLKDRDIEKNKTITKLIPIRENAQELLRMRFRIDFDGDTTWITKNLLIPSFIDSYHMLINGKEVLPQKQIVDMTTYNQKHSCKLKTTLTPIDIYRQDIKEHNFVTTSNNVFPTKTYVLNLFTKELNPFYYYFAKFGATKTIKYFSLNNIIDVVDREYDTDIYYYIRANKDILIEVDKRYFETSELMRSFTYMVYDMFLSSKIKLSEIDDIDYWLVRLGSIFTINTKNQLSKGENVLVSFGRILDDITRETLRLDVKHLQSTHSLIRWMITNFTELRKKDNHNLEDKRVRCNEVTAFYFIQAMSNRINNLLNKRKLSMDNIVKIFNWDADELFKNMLSSKNSLLKYDADINCFELLNALRFSFLGNQGISGGKNIGNQFRDIYPSHLGRIDLNGISHGKNTALTGFLVPKCKVYGNGFFSEKSNDPDLYSSYVHKLGKMLKDNNIEDIKSKISIEKEKLMANIRNETKRNDFKYDESGCVIIHRKLETLLNKDDNTIVISSTSDMDNPFYQRTYRNKDGMSMNEKNNFIIKRISEINEVDGVTNIKSTGITVKEPIVILHRKE